MPRTTIVTELVHIGEKSRVITMWPHWDMIETWGHSQCRLRNGGIRIMLHEQIFECIMLGVHRQCVALFLIQHRYINHYNHQGVLCIFYILYQYYYTNLTILLLLFNQNRSSSKCGALQWIIQIQSTWSVSFIHTKTICVQSHIGLDLLFLISIIALFRMKADESMS